METKYTGIYTYFSEKTTFVDLKKDQQKKMNRSLIKQK